MRRAVTIASRHVICKYANMLLKALHWLLPFGLFSFALAEVICDYKVAVAVDKGHFGVHEIGGGEGVVKNFDHVKPPTLHVTFRRSHRRLYIEHLITQSHDTLAIDPQAYTVQQLALKCTRHKPCHFDHLISLTDQSAAQLFAVCNLHPSQRTVTVPVPAKITWRTTADVLADPPLCSAAPALR